MSQTVEVTIMGCSYPIRTQDDPEHVKMAAKMVQEQVDQLRKLGTVVASDRLLALVALNLAGELLQKGEAGMEGKNSLLSSLDVLVSQAQGLVDVPLR